MYRTLFLAVLLWSCGDQYPRGSLLLPETTEAELQIREDCRLAETRCTRCHTTGRILVASMRTRAEWAPLVEKMRLMTSSGISRLDAEAVLRCLEYRGQSTMTA